MCSISTGKKTKETELVMTYGGRKLFVLVEAVVKDTERTDDKEWTEEISFP